MSKMRLPDETRAALLDAILPHVVFDGWSEASFQAAAADVGIDATEAKLVCPRGALDLAVAYHRRGDAAMRARVALNASPEMRIRERVTYAVRARLEAGEKEIVRRGTTLFALPHHTAEGATLIWGTADAIWTALGDRSGDVNWYTKRATLAGVYGSTVLFWLGDHSANDQATWDFLDRRIEDVMQIEKLKAKVRDNAFLQKAFAGPNWLLSRIKAPVARTDVPGRWPEKDQEPT